MGEARVPNIVDRELVNCEPGVIGAHARRPVSDPIPRRTCPRPLTAGLVF
jgi:hypothetical protein